MGQITIKWTSLVTYLLGSLESVTHYIPQVWWFSSVLKSGKNKLLLYLYVIQHVFFAAGWKLKVALGICKSFHGASLFTLKSLCVCACTCILWLLSCSVIMSLVYTFNMFFLFLLCFSLGLPLYISIQLLLVFVLMLALLTIIILTQIIELTL